MDLQRISELGFESVSTWHTVVLTVLFSKWCNFFLSAQCFVSFILSTSIFAYNLKHSYLKYIMYITDFYYFFEVICTLSYLRNNRLRKLRYTRIRNWFFILIDLISLIPMELMFTYHYISENKNEVVGGILTQNRSLRIYRIYLMESFYSMAARTPLSYILFIFFRFLSRSIILAHVASCVFYNVSDLHLCDKKVFNCYIWTEVNMVNLILLSWSGKATMFDNPKEKLVATCTATVGFFLIFAFIFPNVLYYSMLHSYKRSVNFENRQRLQAFLNNNIKQLDLKMAIQRYFKYLWMENSDVKTLFFNIPLSLQKEVLTDIYWDAFCHSELFRNLSRSFKRSLSLVMTTEYHNDGEVLYYKGQNKKSMMFLVQGIIQIMAEENETSPLVSFSCGTVFGELSLFLNTKSRAIVRCKGNCELQILTFRKLNSTLTDYPKDKKLIFRNLQLRLLLAKHAQWRKHKFKEQQSMKAFTTVGVEDCLNWLKVQWRNLSRKHKRFSEVIKARKEGLRLPSWRIPIRPDIKFEFISNFLDLIVLSNLFEQKSQDVVCLKTKFPWSINPTSQFFTVWRFLIIVVSLVPAIGYPLCTAWLEKFPWEMYLISHIITIIFFADLVLRLFTAVQAKQTIITNFTSILKHNLQESLFYVDFIAALPYQLYADVLWNFRDVESYKIGLLLHPAILKSYVFIKVSVSESNDMEKITLLKGVFLFLLVLYWFAEVIQLVSVVNIFNLNKSEDDKKMEKENRRLYLYGYSVFKALVSAVSASNTKISSGNVVDLLYTAFARYVFFTLFCYLMCDFFSSILIKNFYFEKFQIMVKRIQFYLEKKGVSKNNSSKILKTIKFQWDYDRAEYICSKDSLLKLLPEFFQRRVYYENAYKALQMSTLFQGESDEFLLEVLQFCDFIAVPSGSILATYGHSIHVLTVINRGYCQVNSHLISDVTNNLGRALIQGPGCTFPILTAFGNTSSPITVVTVTDCECIMIPLEDLIGVMIRHHIFKDIVDVMREGRYENKILRAKPALMKVDISKIPVMESKKAVRERLGYCGKFWLHFCPNSNFFTSKNFFFTQKIFKFLELSYVIYVILDSILRSSCFGVLLFYTQFIVPILLSCKMVFALPHLILNGFLPYYNKQGLIVTHPLYTFSHYFSTTFVPYLIVLIPFFPFYYYFVLTPYEKPHVAVISFVFVQLSLNIIYLSSYFNYLASITNNRFFISYIKIVLVLILLFHSIVNLIMFFSTTWEFKSPRRVIGFKVKENWKPLNANLLRNNYPGDYYLLISYWLVCSLTTNNYNLQPLVDVQMYLSYILNFLGLFLNLCAFVCLSSSSSYQHIDGSKYYEEFVTLLQFLKYSKPDHRLVEQANTFYNYELLKTKGENLWMVFRKFPLYLKQELWYPLYRPTFIKNSLFDSANEGFFKILSTHVKSVFFTRGSTIIFRKESQQFLYFVHKGKCFVYDWFMILDLGSIIGDIHQTGVMLNDVYALTHVEMLRIPSKKFFMIINQYDDLETNFFFTIKKAESFVKSDVYRVGHALHPVDSSDAVNSFNLRKKEVGFEDESFFENLEDASVSKFHWLKRSKMKKNIAIIYPYSWAMKVYICVGLADTTLTLLAVSVFMTIGRLSVTAFVTVAVLDFFWLVIMVSTFRIAIIDQIKGDIIANSKFLAGKYLRGAFVLDLLSLIPVELIPIAVASEFKNANAFAVGVLRIFRCTRVFSFYWFRQIDFWVFRQKAYKKCVWNILTIIWIVFLTTNVYAEISSSVRRKVFSRDITMNHLLAYLEAMSSIIDFLTSANFSFQTPTTKTELFFFICVAWLFTYLKGFLISNILSVLYFRNLASSYHREEMSELKSYLIKKDASPILVKEITNYKLNLLRFCRGQSTPKFLTSAPMSLRISIMKDLFINHFLKFPLFEGLDDLFMSQLAARATREVYFPGQKIVEQGDIDHRMYFIHSGEVYVINQTKEKAYVEHVIGRLFAEQYFGEAQGLWISQPHPYTYRGRTLVEAIVLHSDCWADLRRTYPDVTEKIFNKAVALKYITHLKVVVSESFS